MTEPSPSQPREPARRKCYRGTHPRSFEEKYKELADALGKWGEEPGASRIAAAIKGWLDRSPSTGAGVPSTAGLVRTILQAKGIGPRPSPRRARVPGDPDRREPRGREPRRAPAEPPVRAEA